MVTSSVHRFHVEKVVEGLDHPWGVEQLPDGRFLITERAGRLLLVSADGARKTPVSGVPPVLAKGQGGLLDVTLHPDYANNGWLYLAFSKPIGKSSLTEVVRAKLDGDRLTDLETVFDPPPEEATTANHHFGCRIVFDGRGFMFFSIGDRGGPTSPDNLAQSLGSVTGKIHRLHDDGRVPEDNPFVNTPGAAPAIWAYGVRNPQGLVHDPATGRLWETEHGPRRRRTQHHPEGCQLRWPLASFGINYNGKEFTDKTSLPGMEDPVVEWTPVIAASGLELYRRQIPALARESFAGGLAGQKLVRLQLNGTAVTRQENLLENTGRIRDVREFDDGFLYVLYDEPGQLVRLVPAGQP